MKIKIIKCSDSFFWYNKHIGEEVEVLKQNSKEYWVRELNEWRCWNFILKEDAEVVSED